jgi:nucleoside-diphosphate-sugar epimerase
MTKTEHILLCGCGWLGQQLIQPLTQANYTLSATRRSASETNKLIEKGLIAAPFELGHPFPDYLLIEPLKTAAIVMLPPGRRNVNCDNWLSNMTQLCNTLLKGPISHLIFISSTSVYGEHATIITERSPVVPQTASAKAHVELEKHLFDVSEKRCSILRLAGLVGPNRHPITSLSGRQLSEPTKVVNLVHSVDVIEALLRLVKLGPQPQPMHLCSIEHPQRKAYYDTCAEQNGLPKAQFIADSNGCSADTGKAIDATQTWATLGLSPKFPSPYDMVALTD